MNPQPRPFHRYAPSKAIVLTGIVSNVNRLGGHKVGLPLFLSRAYLSEKSRLVAA
jgi:hypothetical protein